MPSKNDAEIAARKIEILAELISGNRINGKDGATVINRVFEQYIKAVVEGVHASAKDHARVVYGLGVGLDAALKALKRKSPVMVRYIDGNALMTWIMEPDDES